MLSTPVSLNSGGVEERLGERDFVADSAAVVVEELDVVVDQAVSEAESGGRELVGDVGIHLGVVAAVGGDGSAAEQRGQQLVVGDRLDLADDELAGGLVDLLVGEPGVGAGDLFGQLVVLADEQRVQGGQLDVLVGPHVAGEEVAGGVGGREVAGAGLELAAGEGAQAGSGGGVGAVDHRAVEPGGDLVDLLAGVARACAGGGVVARAVERDRLRAGAGGVERRVAGGNRDVERFAVGRGRFGQVEVVVDELAPGVDVGGELAVVGGFVAGLVDEGVADFAGAWAVGAGGGRDAVGVGGVGDAEELLVGAAPLGVDEVVACAVEGADFDAEECGEACRA